MVEPKIVWIASYPKSGNTWVRFLVANMLFGEVGTSADIEAMVPDVHRGSEISTRYHISGTIFLKTHWAYADDMPQARQTAAAIYIVRHPLDVLRSHIDYMGLESGGEKFRNFVDAYIGVGGAPAWQRRGYGSWISNVEGWSALRGNAPLLLLRYEDLRADPATGVRTIAEFFRRDISDSDVDTIVEATTFERMKALEDSEISSGAQGFFGTERSRSSDPGFRFMRSGRVGGYRELLSPDQRDAARNRFGPLAETLGYTLD